MAMLLCMVVCSLSSSTTSLLLSYVDASQPEGPANSEPSLASAPSTLAMCALASILLLSQAHLCEVMPLTQAISACNRPVLTTAAAATALPPLPLCLPPADNYERSTYRWLLQRHPKVFDREGLTSQSLERAPAARKALFYTSWPGSKILVRCVFSHSVCCVLAQGALISICMDACTVRILDLS